MNNLISENNQDQMIQSQKLETIGALAGGIAHDFNNMLTSIINNIDMAMDDIKNVDESVDCLKDALTVSRHAKTLVAQILSLSKQHSEQPRKIIVYDIILEALEMLHSSIPPGVKVKTTISNKHLAINGIAIQLYQVIINLCINSLQAMKEKGGGLLEISLEEKNVKTQQTGKKEKFIKMSVTDTGIGIPKKNMEHIFEPFFTTKKSGEGTGMGLTVVSEITQKHNGSISVTSKENQGTTFKILFPEYRQS